MTPFFFGPAARRLYGAFHRPERKRPDPVAVLICNPFGQEYVRCHRMLRTLADRFEQNGIACLRFDYFGTGDSAGMDEDSTLSGWVEDIALAQQELIRRVGACKTIWVGIRLGAVAALVAAAKVTHAPSHLVLWEPIGSGPAYLEYLARCYQQAVGFSYTLVPHDLREQAPGEIIGFGTSAAMLDEIGRLDGSAGREGGPPATWVMPPAPRPELARPPNRSDVTTVVLEHDFEWNSEEALNTALVPAPAVKLLFEQVEARA